MLQPVTPARTLLLLLAVTAAEAQPARGRSVTVAVRPGEPLPEVRVAAGYRTTLVLDAPVDKGSVLLDDPRDSPRIRLVDLGEHSIIFETLVTPGSQERWVLRVRYTDGAQPEWAAFALVAAPGSEVERATCPSWRCPTRAPLARAGVVGRTLLHRLSLLGRADMLQRRTGALTRSTSLG